MGWNNKKGMAAPGQVSENDTDRDPAAQRSIHDRTGKGTAAYGGYIPQRYTRPMVGYEHHVESVDSGNLQGRIGHEPGDGTVQNNTWRGDYGHGVIVNSDVSVQDHTRHNLTDDVTQVMPEHEDLRLADPIKVEVVNRDPDFRVVMNIGTFHVTTQGTAMGGQPMQTGLTPIRVAGKDPHRTRMIIGISAMVGGSNPVLLTSEQSSPLYGFPIASATVTPLTLFTTEEVWVSGQALTDDFTVSVVVERNNNVDPFAGD